MTLTAKIVATAVPALLALGMSVTAVAVPSSMASGAVGCCRWLF